MPLDQRTRSVLKQRGLGDDELNEYDVLHAEFLRLRESEANAELQPAARQARLNALFTKFADSGKPSRRIC